MVAKTRDEFVKKARANGPSVTVNEFGEEIEISNNDPEPPKVKSKDPESNDAIMRNRAHFGEQIDVLAAYKAFMMQAYDRYVTLPMDIDFRAGADNNRNDLYPTVFLGKLITNTELRKRKDKHGKDTPVVVNHFEHIQVRYEEKPEEKRTLQTFTAANFITNHDLAKHDEINAKRALIEMIKSAYLLAEHAKANNWTEVNFGRTTDPVKRYILAQACKDLELNCSSERVEANALPKVPSLESDGVTLDLHIRAYAKMFRENIYLPVEPQAAEPKKTRAQPEPQPAAV